MTKRSLNELIESHKAERRFGSVGFTEEEVREICDDIDILADTDHYILGEIIVQLLDLLDPSDNEPNAEEAP